MNPKKINCQSAQDWKNWNTVLNAVAGCCQSKPKLGETAVASLTMLILEYFHLHPSVTTQCYTSLIGSSTSNMFSILLRLFTSLLDVGTLCLYGRIHTEYSTF